MKKDFIIKIYLNSPESALIAELLWRKDDDICMRNVINVGNDTIVISSLSINLLYVKSIERISDEEYLKYKNIIINAPANKGKQIECVCKNVIDIIKSKEKIKCSDDPNIYKLNINLCKENEETLKQKEAKEETLKQKEANEEIYKVQNKISKLNIKQENMNDKKEKKIISTDMEQIKVSVLDKILSSNDTEQIKVSVLENIMSSNDNMEEEIVEKTKEEQSKEEIVEKTKEEQSETVDTGIKTEEISDKSFIDLVQSSLLEVTKKGNDRKTFKQLQKNQEESFEKVKSKNTNISRAEQIDNSITRTYAKNNSISNGSNINNSISANTENGSKQYSKVLGNTYYKKTINDNRGQYNKKMSDGTNPYGCINKENSAVDKVKNEYSYDKNKQFGNYYKKPAYDKTYTNRHFDTKHNKGTYTGEDTTHSKPQDQMTGGANPGAKRFVVTVGSKKYKNLSALTAAIEENVNKNTETDDKWMNKSNYTVIEAGKLLFANFKEKIKRYF